MAKDKRARAEIVETMVAWANLVGAITDTLVAEEYGNDAAHAFLDRLESVNMLTMDGRSGRFCRSVVAAIRVTVPVND